MPRNATFGKGGGGVYTGIRKDAITPPRVCSTRVAREYTATERTAGRECSTGVRADHGRHFPIFPQSHTRSITHKARRTHINGAGLQNSMRVVQVTTQQRKAPQIERKAGIWRAGLYRLPDSRSHRVRSGTAEMVETETATEYRERAATLHESTEMQCFCKDFLQNVCIYQKKAVPLQYQIKTQPRG